MEILLIVYRTDCFAKTFLVQYWLLPISAVGSLVHNPLDLDCEFTKNTLDAVPTSFQCQELQQMAVAKAMTHNNLPQNARRRKSNDTSEKNKVVRKRTSEFILPRPNVV